MTIPEAIAHARRSGKAVRVQRRDGERLVLRVLAIEGDQLLYAVYHSTHPERYAVCDSVGFEMELGEIEEATLLERPPALRRAVLD